MSNHNILINVVSTITDFGGKILQNTFCAYIPFCSNLGPSHPRSAQWRLVRVGEE
ncbi:hypothetical protein [Mandarin fish ranavirus]|nr:hypothetical protein [Mandarin fish ranavirus]